jgi:hypothetical protein
MSIFVSNEYTMLALSRDVFVYLICFLDPRSVLSIARVCRHINPLCTLAWPILYERRYHRQGTAAQYKQHVLSAGTVVRYSGDLELEDVKLYIETECGPAYINVHDELVFEGSIIAQQVVDVESDYAQLWVLTESSFTVYNVYNLAHSRTYQLEHGRSIVVRDDGACVELTDGRIILPKETEWYDITEHCTRDFQFDDVQLRAVKEYNVVEDGNMCIVLHDKLYLTYNDRVAWSLDVAPCKMLVSSEYILVTTRDGRLLRTSYTGEYTTLDEKVLPESLVECYGDVYYIRLTL